MAAAANYLTGALHQGNCCRVQWKRMNGKSTFHYSSTKLTTPMTHQIKVIGNSNSHQRSNSSKRAGVIIILHTGIQNIISNNYMTVNRLHFRCRSRRAALKITEQKLIIPVQGPEQIDVKSNNEITLESVTCVGQTVTSCTEEGYDARRLALGSLRKKMMKTRCQ